MEGDKNKVKVQFDSYIRKVVRCTVINYNKHKKSICEKEISLTAIPLELQEKYFSYEQDLHPYYKFIVCNITIIIKDDKLVSILKLLDKRQRETVLMSYCLNMKDDEI